jgi:hypothetical protein
MKRIFVLGFVLLFLGAALFADDAKVMPARMGRFYIAPTFAFANGFFDEDGARKSYDSGEGALKLFNLGFALEYGIIDWITGAVQWAPGWNVWSDVDQTLPGSTSDVNVKGVNDIFLGAKMQIIGPSALVQSEKLRLAFGPGVKIPLPAADYEEQYTNMGKNDPVTAANTDYHVFSFGLRSYFDFIINKYFFINVYNEFLYYPVKGDMKKAGLNPYGIAYAVDQFKGFGFDYGDVTYGYDLTFELEPAFSYTTQNRIILSAGLPVNYKMTPGVKYDITKPNRATVESAIDNQSPPGGTLDEQKANAAMKAGVASIYAFRMPNPPTTWR